MSYTHVLVSDLNKNESSEEAVAKGWEYWVDGLAVAPQLASFALALRVKFPALKFHASEYNENCRATVVKDNATFIEVYTDLDVYVDDCDFTLGVIGFGKNYGVSSSDTQRVAPEVHVPTWSRSATVAPSSTRFYGIEPSPPPAGVFELVLYKLKQWFAR